MPLINPFNPEPKIESTVTKEQHDRVIAYLDCPNWKCPNCGCVVFGRTLICPYNRNGIYCKTGRPE